MTDCLTMVRSYYEPSLQLLMTSFQSYKAACTPTVIWSHFGHLAISSLLPPFAASHSQMIMICDFFVDFQHLLPISSKSILEEIAFGLQPDVCLMTIVTKKTQLYLQILSCDASYYDHNNLRLKLRAQFIVVINQVLPVLELHLICSNPLYYRTVISSLANITIILLFIFLDFGHWLTGSVWFNNFQVFHQYS